MVDRSRSGQVELLKYTGWSGQAAGRQGQDTGWDRNGYHLCRWGEPYFSGSEYRGKGPYALGQEGIGGGNNFFELWTCKRPAVCIDVPYTMINAPAREHVWHWDWGPGSEEKAAASSGISKQESSGGKYRTIEVGKRDSSISGIHIAELDIQYHSTKGCITFASW